MTVARRRAEASRPDHRAASLTSPWSLTHSASTPSGDQVVGDAGGDLHARVAVEQALDERPRRRPPVRAEGAAVARAASRVGVRDVEGGGVHGGRVDDGHRATEPEGGQVGLGHRDAQGVQVDTGDGDPGLRDGHQVAADPAAEVDHAAGRRRLQPAGPVPGHGQPGGLLQTLAGEVHPPRQRPELGVGVPAELHLAERGRDVRRARVAPQLGLPGQLVAAGRRRPRQQLLAVVGQQPPEGVEVHPGILSVRRAHPAARHLTTPVGTPTGRVLASGLALSP